MNGNLTMKTLLTSLALLLALGASAQKNIASLDIKTSTICDICEKTIETELIYEKGVKKVDVHLDDSMVHVQYDETKTSPEKIRVAISKLGYSADDVPGDEAAFKKLPACCQKEGCGKPKTGN